MAELQRLIAERQDRIHQLEAELAQQRAQLSALEKRKRRSMLGSGAANMSTRVALGRGLKSLISPSKELSSHTGGHSVPRELSSSSSGTSTGSAEHHGDGGSGSFASANGSACGSSAGLSSAAASATSAAPASASSCAAALHGSGDSFDSVGPTSNQDHGALQFEVNNCQGRRDQVIATLSEVFDHTWSENVRRRKEKQDAERRKMLRDLRRSERVYEPSDVAHERRRHRRQRRKRRRRKLVEREAREAEARQQETDADCGPAALVACGYVDLPAVDGGSAQAAADPKEVERHRLQQATLLNPLLGSVVELRKDRAQSLATPSHGGSVLGSSSDDELTSSGSDSSSTSDSDSNSVLDSDDERPGSSELGSGTSLHSGSDLTHAELDIDLHGIVDLVRFLKPWTYPPHSMYYQSFLWVLSCSLALSW
jgi:hypothetical protein